MASVEVVAPPTILPFVLQPFSRIQVLLLLLLPALCVPRGVLLAFCLCDDGASGCCEEVVESCCSSMVRLLWCCGAHEDDEHDQLVPRTTVHAARRSRSTTSRSRSLERRRRWSTVRWWRSISTGPRRPADAIRPRRSLPRSPARAAAGTPPRRGADAPVESGTLRASLPSAGTVGACSCVPTAQGARHVPVTGSSHLSVLRISAALMCAACAAPRAADTTHRGLGLVHRRPLSDGGARRLRPRSWPISTPCPSRRRRRTELADPSLDGYWHGAAYAFAPRSARRARPRSPLLRARRRRAPPGRSACGSWTTRPAVTTH